MIVQAIYGCEYQLRSAEVPNLNKNGEVDRADGVRPRIGIVTSEGLNAVQVRIIG